MAERTTRHAWLTAVNLTCYRHRMPVRDDPRIPDLLSAPEAAELLGISRQAVHKMLVAGRLPARRVGREWVIRRAAVDRYRKDIAGSE